MKREGEGEGEGGEVTWYKTAYFIIFGFNGEEEVFCV